jgi:hypothetical protein
VAAGHGAGSDSIVNSPTSCRPHFTHNIHNTEEAGEGQHNGKTAMIIAAAAAILLAGATAQAET